jgi:hypothetical protein
MNYVCFNIHKANTSSPFYELSVIQANSDVPYTWESDNPVFDIQDHIDNKSVPTIFMENIYSYFALGENIYNEKTRLFLANWTCQTVTFLHVTQLGVKSERFQEIIPIKIRKSANHHYKCGRCVEHNRMAENCSRVLVLGLKEYVVIHFPGESISKQLLFSMACVR